MNTSIPTTMNTAAAEHHVDACAALLALPIAAEHREGVLRYFGIAAQLAELVMAHPLALEDEPAALFVPVAPADR